MTGTHRIRRLVSGILILFLVLAAAAAIYISDYSRASDTVRAYLQDTAEVAVREIPEGLFLDGPGTENALIFYPGGKVEYTAYLPLLHRLAEGGTDCFLVKMPANLAFLGINRAGDIMKAYDYDGWYLAGHSLGGVAAASYASGHDLKGLILLASYATQPVDEPVLQIYGSEDGILNLDALEQNAHNLPADTSVEVLDGANHAGFGDYGDQKGDGEARITQEEQQAITADLIEEMIGETSADDSEGDPSAGPDSSAGLPADPDTAE